MEVGDHDVRFLTRNLLPGDPHSLEGAEGLVGRREGLTGGGVDAQASFRLVGAGQACL